MTTVARDVVTPAVYRCIDKVFFEAMNNVDEVILASPRGFCAGVEMAIKALAWMVRTFDEPVYCYHEIVHNKIVVDRFKSLGVVFVDDLDQIPKGRPIMLSAHGSAPQVVTAARELGSYVVDSVCPLVTKVHHEVKTRANKGYRIVYIGHDGHEEAVGTMAVAPDSISRVETLAEVDALEQFNEPVAILAQTTLSHRDWKDVADAVRLKYPQVWSPGKSDLCFATTNRQGALMQIARECDAIIVIGSDNSSNTRALEKLAKDVGCKNVYRVNDASELPKNFSGTVGVTAGASAPEELVAEIIQILAPTKGVREIKIAQEDEYFPPPRHIRQLQTSIELVATAMLGGSYVSRKIVDDRKTAASRVLALLAN
ncbi:MAG: 4-hydroxy-3-methylbut-2-enyl diphosphate reductase [Actinomycetota bacterium]